MTAILAVYPTFITSIPLPVPPTSVSTTRLPRHLPSKSHHLQSPYTNLPSPPPSPSNPAPGHKKKIKLRCVPHNGVGAELIFPVFVRRSNMGKSRPRDHPAPPFFVRRCNFVVASRPRDHPVPRCSTLIRFSKCSNNVFFFAGGGCDGYGSRMIVDVFFSRKISFFPLVFGGVKGVE